jgi:hypothetical protein
MVRGQIAWPRDGFIEARIHLERRAIHPRAALAPGEHQSDELAKQLGDNHGVLFRVSLEELKRELLASLVESPRSRSLLLLRGSAASHLPPHRVARESKLARDALRSHPLRRQLPQSPHRVRLDHRHLLVRRCHSFRFHVFHVLGSFRKGPRGVSFSGAWGSVLRAPYTFSHAVSFAGP